ncbi:SLIT and NTRK-like protein 2 [Asterias rubens]|uniref:SLIT and NTRK-like protein 2 n=1 Tax=Asterias rubens TaxID=7604 RepID=UPI00145580EC|nr:SLIT and NTRK-like protein 2 [Asterias rubens]
MPPKPAMNSDLSMNFLREKPEDWLLQFDYLVYLSVSGNLISNSFKVPPSLRSLSAYDNQLQDIRMMMETGKLWKVSFARNKLEVIRTDTFRNCNELAKVGLSANKISQIEPGGLSVSNSTEIWLNDNPGVELSPAAFGGRRFKSISLQGNHLTSIESYTLGGMLLTV